MFLYVHCLRGDFINIAPILHRNILNMHKIYGLLHVADTGWEEMHSHPSCAPWTAYELHSLKIRQLNQSCKSESWLTGASLLGLIMQLCGGKGVVGVTEA